jgi:hypothetical protein
MEAIRIKSVDVFTPITIKVTINTQKEYAALVRAEESLCKSDISDEHSWEDRNIWVDTLDAISRAARSAGDDK